MKAANSISRKELFHLAQEEGLSLLGLASVAPLIDHEKHLSQWQERGYAADMAYMRREATLLTDPRRTFPEAKSLAVVLLDYGMEPHPPRPPGFGRVARYAWGRDYHQVLPAKLESLAKKVSTKVSGLLNYKVFSDAVPLLERALAHDAGLGFIGKNTLLIRKKYGSFSFIGEILWDLEFEDYDKLSSNSLSLAQDPCGSCQRCLSDCPTGALVENRVLDARKCISYLTIERRASFSAWEREAIGEWVFGCDECQEVCPFNHSGLEEKKVASVQEFRSSAGVGPLLNLAQILSLSNEQQFKTLFSGTAILRAKRSGIVRNAIAVSANTLAIDLAALIELRAKEDVSAAVRAVALWALWKLGSTTGGLRVKALRAILEHALKDSDEIVRLEAQRILEGKQGI